MKWLREMTKHGGTQRRKKRAVRIAPQKQDQQEHRDKKQQVIAEGKNNSYEKISPLLVFLEGHICWVVNTKFAEGSSSNHCCALRFFVLDGYQYNRRKYAILNNGS